MRGIGSCRVVSCQIIVTMMMRDKMSPLRRVNETLFFFICTPYIVCLMFFFVRLLYLPFFGTRNE